VSCRRFSRAQPSLALWLAALACSGEQAPEQDPAIARGLRTYQNVCIACHSADPAQEGTLGPAIAGASEDLLRAKLLRGGYPLGYTPKRPGSSAMPQFAYLEARIPDLVAYLASAARSAPHAG
jgi:mono/diheme cytochrome c family protein